MEANPITASRAGRLGRPNTKHIQENEDLAMKAAVAASIIGDAHGNPGSKGKRKVMSDSESEAQSSDNSDSGDSPNTEDIWDDDSGGDGI